MLWVKFRLKPPKTILLQQQHRSELWATAPTLCWGCHLSRREGVASGTGAVRANALGLAPNLYGVGRSLPASSAGSESGSEDLVLTNLEMLPEATWENLSGEHHITKRSSLNLGHAPFDFSAPLLTSYEFQLFRGTSVSRGPLASAELARPGCLRPPGCLESREPRGSRICFFLRSPSLRGEFRLSSRVHSQIFGIGVYKPNQAKTSNTQREGAQPSRICPQIYLI